MSPIRWVCPLVTPIQLSFIQQIFTEYHLSEKHISDIGVGVQLVAVFKLDGFRSAWLGKGLQWGTQSIITA